MNWLVLLFAVEAGFMPIAGWLEYPSQYATDVSESYYTQLETEAVAFDTAFIGGSVATYMLPAGLGFEVFGTTYTFETGLRFEPLEIGFRHVCGPHPVNAYPQFGNRANVDGAFEGAYQQVYLRLESRLE